MPVATRLENVLNATPANAMPEDERTKARSELIRWLAERLVADAMAAGATGTRIGDDIGNTSAPRSVRTAAPLSERSGRADSTPRKAA